MQRILVMTTFLIFPFPLRWNLRPNAGISRGRRQSAGVPKLRDHRPPPGDASLHRQANTIVLAVPTYESLESLIELRGACGWQPRAREAVPGVEGLDVVIDRLGIDYSVGLSSPIDGHQPSRLELCHKCRMARNLGWC